MKKFIFVLMLFVICKSFVFAQNDKFFDKSPLIYKVKRQIALKPNDSIHPILIMKIYFNHNKRKNIMSLSMGMHKNLRYRTSKDFSREIIFQNDTMYIKHESIKDPVFVFKKQAIGDTLTTQKGHSIFSNHKISLEKIVFIKGINDEVYVFNLERQSDDVVMNVKGNKIIKTSSRDYIHLQNIAISKKYGFIWVNYKFLSYDIELWFK